MFDMFNVNGLYVAIQSVLAMYAAGRTTGLVCGSGDGFTRTVPIFEGFALPHAVRKNFVAGSAITSQMVKDIVIEEGIM